MQNALIKKKLEEQRENFRKRQELQHQQQHHQNGPQFNQNSAESNNESNIFNQTRGVSPNVNNQQQKPHISSPTPALAFTPTSVLRKMTAEKDTDNAQSNPGNSKEKVLPSPSDSIPFTHNDFLSLPLQQAQNQAQAQAQQNVVQHSIFNRMAKPDDVQSNELSRMLQHSQRLDEKDGENINFINGNNKDMSSVSNEPFCLLRSRLTAFNSQIQMNHIPPMFHGMMPPGEMPVNDLMRMLQIQNRPGDKEPENGVPANTNKEMNKVIIR